MRFGGGGGAAQEDLNSPEKTNSNKPAGEAKNVNGKPAGSLKVDCGEGESSTAPLDLTHRSPTSSAASDNDEEATARLLRRESSAKQAAGSSPEHKLGSDIEEHLQFLKVKQ